MTFGRHPPSTIHHPLGRAGGYTLAGLMIVLIVLEIAIAIAVPLWSGAAKRDREEELIFRGLQYAEAVRVFQQMEGRLPAGLKELAEHEPRVLRQAWTNPIAYEDGWLPVLQPETLEQIDGQGQVAGQELRGGQPGLSGPRGNNQQNRLGNQQRGRQQGREQRQGFSRNRRLGDREGQEIKPFLGGSLDDLEDTTLGAFFGVKPGSTGEATLTFFGGEDYSDWEFRPELLIQPPSPDGRIQVPRLWSQRFWVPVPGAGEIAGGEGPSQLGDGDGERRRSTFDQRDSDRNRNNRQRN